MSGAPLADAIQVTGKAAGKDAAAALRQAEQRARKAEEKLAAAEVELQLRAEELAALKAELGRGTEKPAGPKAEPLRARPEPGDHHGATNGAHSPERTATPELPGEAAGGGAAEQGLPRASGPDGFYDAVLAIEKLENLYDPERGWHVRQRDFDLAAEREGVRVIPVGHFNSGKTWLIGQLSGANLPSGVHVHTEGISIKEATTDGLKIVLLDTVGSNSPMYALPDGVGPTTASAGAEAVLQELRAQEDFYRQLCYEVGQVILLVVGQMSHKDQTDLVRLARTIRKDRVRKDIVVVHNLREWDMAMLVHPSEKDGLNYMERTRTLFGLSEARIEVTIGTETDVIVRHQGLFEGEGDSRDNVVSVYHYYLTNDRLPCSRNRFAIADMKATITRGKGGARPLSQELAAAAAKLQSRFASFSGSEPEVVFDACTSRFRVKAPLPEGAFKMRPRDLGGYFALGSDEPSCSITLLPCTAAKVTGRGAARKVESQERGAYHLQIELPGLCAKSLAQIEAQLALKGEGGALVREQLEGERGTQWTVSFQAKLLNVPQALYQQVQESTDGEVQLLPDPAAHEITDAGSRPNFRDGERTVKVTLRTGIMDYDSSEDPVVTYLDGVLGITLMREAR